MALEVLSILPIFLICHALSFQGALDAGASKMYARQHALPARCLLLVLAGAEGRAHLVSADLRGGQRRVRGRRTAQGAWRCLERLDGRPALEALHLPAVVGLARRLLHHYLHVYHF